MAMNKSERNISMKDKENNGRLISLESWLASHIDLVAFCIMSFAFFVYIYYGTGYYLNPDEASIFFKANSKNLLRAYAASHITAHPPLFIVVLHSFLWLGNSVFILRFLSVALGTAALWLAFKWVQRTFGSVEALVGLIFLAFSPGMVTITCEVRQYAMLLFFICGALYFLQRFLEEDSLWFVFVYSVFLYGAILTHYSSLWIVLALGIYVTILLWWKKRSWQVCLFWVISQVGVVVLYSFLYFTHIRRLQNSGFAEAQIQGYLKSRYFWPGEETIISFIARSGLDVFAYFGGGKLAGITILVCFLLGIVIILLKRSSGATLKNDRHYSLLLVLPFIIGCIGAIIRVLPFGGGRHVSYFLPFVAAGFALCVVRVLSLKRLSLALVAGMVLVPIWMTCWHPPNAVPSMSDSHMKAALAQLNEKVPSDALLFVDDMTHYVLAYYLARDQFPLKGRRHETAHEYHMGKYRVVSARTWKFSPTNFDYQIVAMSRSFNIVAGDVVWVMTVGWHNAERFNAFLDRYPHERIKELWNFGPITLLQISIPPKMG